jgi:hypothetical protein
MLFEVNSSTSLAQRLQEWAAKPKLPSPTQAVSTADEMVERTLAVYAAFQRAR